MTIAELRAQNLRVFLEDGVRLSTRYAIWVVARCPAVGKIKLGGLGACGCGEMWVSEEAHHRDYVGYQDAEVVQNLN